MSLAFVHLNVHSNFSILSGTRRVEELVAAARLAGMSALALTDTNGLYAAIPFQMACRAADVHPVFGVELRHAGRRAVVLARDAVGYGEVCRLVSRRHLDADFALGPALAAASDHVFILCGEAALLAGLRGRTNVYVEIVCHHDVDSRRHKYRLLDVAERLQLPIVATNAVHFIRPDEHRIHRVLCAIRTNTTIGTLPPGEVEPEGCWLRSPGEMQALFTDLPQALENTAHIAWSCHHEIPIGHPRPPRFELPQDDVRRHSSHRLHWRRDIAERVARHTTTGDSPRVLARTDASIPSLPEWPTQPRGQFRAGAPDAPAGEASGADARSLASGSLASLGARPVRASMPSRRPRDAAPEASPAGAFAFLRALCDEGLLARVAAPGRAAARAALERELDVIQRLDLVEYFLVCWDLVRFARAHGMPCLGRGSAANSMVSYCLYVTHVNPVEHNLFFERFLNLERASFPDFDIDFGTDDREVVLDYIFERYGRENVAMICTYNTMHARSAMREVAKALGIATGEIDAVVKRVPGFASVRDLQERIAGDPARRGLPLDREPFRTILEIAAHIAEFPRHLATHPCGLVIAPEPILNLVPLQRGDKGLEITQWDMNAVEDAGLIKIDILGQKGLAVIGDTIRQVEHNLGLRIDPEAEDVLHDAGGRELLRTGRTIGCFYIESPIMLQLMEQAHCDDFEVLTALSSIIRPGVSNHGGKRQYLERHLGLQPVTFLHPRLEPVLRDTYGCLIYQEQVIQVAQAIAGMTLSEADGLRKCMSKKRHWERMDTYRERFFAGARRNEVPEHIATEIYRQIESFAGYAFCKAHSASFALESFASAAWKARYPAEFMAAVLTNQGGYYTPMEYAEETRRLGVRLLPPCIHTSRAEFWGENHTLRVGLMAVKGLAAETITALLEARHAGPFRNLGDFLARVPATRAEAVGLIRCGAMECFGHTRPHLLWELALRTAVADAAPGAASRGRREDMDVRTGRAPSDVSEPEASERASAPGAASATAFPATPAVETLVAKIPELPEYDARQRMRAEIELLGLTLEAHPFALFADALARVRRLRPIVASTDLQRHDGKPVYLLGWKVTAKRSETVKGEPMCFVTFSDEVGRFEASFFPEAYARCALELIRGMGPFLVKGKVEVAFGVAELLATHVKLLARPPAGAAAVTAPFE